MNMGYQIELEQDGDTILVTCPSLSKVNTFGGDGAEARVFASQAIEEALVLLEILADVPGSIDPAARFGRRTRQPCCH